MISHVHVYKVVKEFIERHGYEITSWTFDSPLKAKHPQHGEIEVYFYGENYTIDENTLPFGRIKWSRSEFIQFWKTEKSMMDEEAAHTCIARAFLLVMKKLLSRKTTKRIALAFPRTHNFMEHCEILIDPWAKAGLEFFLVESNLAVSPVGRFWDRKLPLRPITSNKAAQLKSMELPYERRNSLAEGEILPRTAGSQCNDIEPGCATTQVKRRNSVERL